MKTILAFIITMVALAWGWDVLVIGRPTGAPWWVVRQEALYLSGLLSIAMLSLAMLLATRPTWLEGALGGLDRIYRAHRWAGILAGAFAAMHWLIELSSSVLKAVIGRAGRVPKENYLGWLEGLRDLAKDMGEWAIYGLLAMLLITLCKRFPYRPWRFLHQAMPALYLMLAFHAVLLAPAVYWTQPAGWLLAVLITGGGYGSIVALSGRIGRSRQFQGEIVTIDRSSPAVVALRCRLPQRWPGHRAGQFAFLSFDDREGQHPFTIANADHGDRELSFEIKALGDYTRSLGRRLQTGQTVGVEGPYGRFDLARQDRQAQQIWIAGGIGVTPFLAWLESLRERPGDAPTAELHYCTRDRADDPYVARLAALCASLPALRLQVHGSRQGEELTAGMLAAGKDPLRRAEVWFCGPPGLATTLHDGLQRIWRSRLRFHQEAFSLR